MNCSDVEPFLDRLDADPKGLGIPNEFDLRQHLSSCSSCQLSLQMRHQWDCQLSHAMNDVDLPDGLANRLATLLQEALPLETKSNPLDRSIPRRWLRMMTVMAGLSLVVASLWWTIVFKASGQLSSANVVLLWEHQPDTISSESAIYPKLPHGWTSLRNISTHEWKQMKLADLHVTLSVKPFEHRYRDGEPEEGWLFVIPKSRWTPAPVASVSLARVQYSSRRVWIVWSEGDLVYVLAISGSPQTLERMQRQLDGDRAVF